MDIDVTIKVPNFVYNLYEDAAVRLGDCTPAEAMAGALQAYAQHIVEEMISQGELPVSQPELKLYRKETE